MRRSHDATSITPWFTLGAFGWMSLVASAQNVGDWSWVVTDTGDGDGLVEPGESVLLTLLLAFDPPQPQEGGGLGTTEFYDLLGNAAWEQGTIDQWEGFLCHLIDCGDVQPNNDILGIRNSQSPLLFNNEFRPDNPIALYAIQWTPASYDGQIVALDNGGPDLFVYTDGFGSGLDYEGTGGFVSFRVVPAPATLLLVTCAGGMNVTTRRRR